MGLSPRDGKLILLGRVQLLTRRGVVIGLHGAILAHLNQTQPTIATVGLHLEIDEHLRYRVAFTDRKLDWHGGGIHVTELVASLITRRPLSPIFLKIKGGCG